MTTVYQITSLIQITQDSAFSIVCEMITNPNYSIAVETVILHNPLSEPYFKIILLKLWTSYSAIGRR